MIGPYPASFRSLRVLSYIYMEFRKIVLMILHGPGKGDTDVKIRLLDSMGEGEGGLI